MCLLSVFLGDLLRSEACLARVLAVCDSGLVMHDDHMRRPLLPILSDVCALCVGALLLHPLVVASGTVGSDYDAVRPHRFADVLRVQRLVVNSCLALDSLEGGADKLLLLHLAISAQVVHVGVDTGHVVLAVL